MKQQRKTLYTYRFYKTLDHIPLLNMIGLSERIERNCQSIYYGDSMENLDNLWHETFDMIYYDITGTVPKNNVTFNTDFESKVMRWNLSKLHENNNNKNLTTQQSSAAQKHHSEAMEWLNLFQSKVRTLPNEPRYMSLMYAHWLYKQYRKSVR